MFQANQVSFCNIKIPTVKDPNGVIWVAIKPIIVSMGLDWNNQYDKVVYREEEFHPQNMLYNKEPHVFIPLDNLNAYLFSINYRMCPNPVVRENVRKYQRECANALRDYWLYGVANNGRELPYDDSSCAKDYGKAARQRLKHFIMLYAGNDVDVAKLIEEQVDGLIKNSISNQSTVDTYGLSAIRLAITQEILARSVAACWRGQLSIPEGLKLIETWTKEALKNLGNQLLVQQVVFQRDDGSLF